ncbi:MAG TPA: Beta-galactosidase C-terminal domain, partial [Anaerolineae bacterium]|nr:Beta-galactosidase C-terminal domain [Anaerolineae bacterium]HQJ12579.1 Beta-galactosidase C-terminal domain [Anaerolineae bacterium]
EADGSRYLIALNFAAEPRTLALAEAEAGRILLSTHLDREEPVTLGALQLRAHEGVIIAL